MTTYALPADFEAMFLQRVDALDFSEVFLAARAESDQIRRATSPMVDAPDGTDYWITADQRSGFAIRADGELVFVFSLERGRGDHLIRAAVDRGAMRLDCFDGHLTELYARHGFVERRRDSNWTPGEPDVVYMAHLGNVARLAS